MYDQARFFTMTSERLGSRDTVEEGQAELDRVVARMLPEPTSAPASRTGRGLTIEEDRDHRRATSERLTANGV